MKNVLILGASTDPSRYSYKAAIALYNLGYSVVLVGRQEAKINDSLLIKSVLPENIDIDTVTIYINPYNQVSYYDAILKLKPKRVIFNPGSENDEFARILEDAGIEVEESCTLVMLATKTF